MLTYCVNIMAAIALGHVPRTLNSISLCKVSQLWENILSLHFRRLDPYYYRRKLSIINRSYYICFEVSRHYMNPIWND